MNPELWTTLVVAAAALFGALTVYFKSLSDQLKPAEKALPLASGILEFHLAPKELEIGQAMAAEMERIADALDRLASKREAELMGQMQDIRDKLGALDKPARRTPARRRQT